MPREDLSDRFDYLFEPLDVDELPGDQEDAATHAFPPPQDEGRWSRRIVLTGVVLATLAAAVATAVVLLQPPRPRQPTVTPTDATPMSTPIPTSPSHAMPSPIPTTTEPPVPVLPATVSTSVARPPSSPAPTAAPPPSIQPPSPAASEPAATMAPPPTTRAPMSVSPETRAPFPNQSPPRKNDQGGGLLGGLL